MRKIPKKLIQILRWIVTFGLLVLVGYYFAKHRDQLVQLGQISPWVVVLLFVLNSANNMVYTLRLRLIFMKKSGRRLPFWSWMRIYFVSRFLGFYAGQTGTVYRAVQLKKQYNITLTQYLSSFFFVTWTDLLLAFLFAWVTILTMDTRLVLFGVNAGLLLAVLMGVLFFFPIGAHVILSRIKLRNQYLSWVHGRLQELFKAAVDSLRDPVYILKIILAGLTSFLLATSVIYLCFQDMDIRISIAGASLFSAILKLSNRIVITPGNMGIRELAYGIISEQLGIGVAQGMLVSVIIRLITVIVITASGILAGGLGLLAKRPTKSNP